MTTTNDNPFAVEQRSSTLARPIFRTLALVSLCCAAAYGVHLLSRQWLIERLSFGIDQHPASVQSERLAMLAEFGAAGLPTLVNAACSENNALSQNAYRTIVDLQGRWLAGSTGDAPTMNLALVQAIESSVETCPPQRRSILAALLKQNIIETVDSTNRKDQQSYQKSQQLLALIGPGSLGTVSSGRASLDPSLSAMTNGRVGNQALALPGDSSEARNNFETASNVDPVVSSGSLLPPLPTQLLNIDRQDSGNAIPSNLGPDWVSADGIPTSIGSIKDTAPPAAIEDNPLVLDRRNQVEPVDTLTDNPLATYDIRSVIDFLASPQPSLVKAAEQELRVRKLSETEMQLARRLVASDVEVRLALIKELPGRTDVDPRTWLLWLSNDFERQVRLDAIAVLGSMDDPAIQTALRERLSSERDLVVVNRIRRILGLR